MSVLSHPHSFEADASAEADQHDYALPPALMGDETVHSLPRAAKTACFKEAARRLSPALLHVIHLSTSKSRDRALAALIVLIYGPTPFGGANNIKDVAVRYGMTEQNLHQLVATMRSLLQSPLSADDNHG